MPKLFLQKRVVGGPSVCAGTMGWSPSRGRGAGKAVLAARGVGAERLPAAVSAVPVAVDEATAAATTQARDRAVRDTRLLQGVAVQSRGNRPSGALSGESPMSVL